MFGVYFGKFLENKGIITSQQLEELLEESANSRVKLGLLAVNHGYMNAKQADEVNMLQQMQDKRFGDIAIEKGYLTQEQLGELLAGQGDPYLLFIQSLVEHNILELGNIQTELNDFKKTENLTANDVEAIKSGDIDRITPIFMKSEEIPTMVKDYVGLLARNLVRFIDRNIRLEEIEIISEYSTEFLGAQKLNGDYSVFTGFCGNAKGILKIAESFAKEEFETIDLDVLDAACEFLNCNNGLFATSACNNGIEIDMEPPIMKDEAVTIKTDKVMYRVPMYIGNDSVDVVLSIEGTIDIG